MKLGTAGTDLSELREEDEFNEEVRDLSNRC
jgi:hypothetical protein